MAAPFALVPVTLTGALACGGFLALVSNLKHPLALRLNVPEQRVGHWLAGLHLMVVPLFPLAGVFIDTLGLEHGLILASLLAAVGVSMLALRDSVLTSLAAIPLLAAALAGLTVAATVLMPAALSTQATTAAVNLGYILVGLGFLLGPLLFAGLLSKLRWRRGLLLVALLCLVPALIASLTPNFPVPTSADVAGVLNSPAVWLAALVGFFYLPVEAAMSTWASTNLQSLGCSPRETGWLVAGFWIALLLARLAMVYLIEAGAIPTGSEPWLLLGLGVCVFMAMGNLMGAGGKANIGWSLLMVGFACGPILPTLLGFLMHRNADDAGTAVGTLLGMSTLGALLVMPLMGWHGEGISPQRALGIPLIASVLLAGAALVLGLAM